MFPLNSQAGDYFHIFCSIAVGMGIATCVKSFGNVSVPELLKTERVTYLGLALPNYKNTKIGFRASTRPFYGCKWVLPLI